jgi:hypothetical protein
MVTFASGTLTVESMDGIDLTWLSSVALQLRHSAEYPRRGPGRAERLELVRPKRIAANRREPDGRQPPGVPPTALPRGVAAVASWGA